MGKNIESLEGYVRRISQVTASGTEVLAYRGHSSRSYKLLPSVLRTAKHQEAEHAMLRELVAAHPSEFDQDQTTLDQLARAQHYALPTRLLDITWNPLVALYFACSGHEDETGDVVVLRVTKDSLKYYDSDTVSCIANLAHLSEVERSTIDFTLTGDPFQAQAPVDRLLQFIKVEKPHFRHEIRPADLKSAACVKPKKSSQRILVQGGAFLVFGIRDDLDAEPQTGITVEHILINGPHKKTMLGELDRMSINRSSLFPEIERAAIYIKDRV